MTISPDDLYVALINSPGRIVRRMQYRCSTKRCLLLDVIDVPDEEILLHQKRYKYSSEENLKRSSQAGRQRNTSDGDKHWKPRTYWIGQSSLELPVMRDARIGLSCDHVLDFELFSGDFHHDWEAGHAEVIVRPDASRYVP